ncbi:MAG: glycosyltransferase family 2 protein [Solirubrobacteraceae bacterium]
MRDPEISVVAPVYGCAGCLDALHQRVAAALDEAGESWELVLVDDASPDGAWERIEQICAADPRVRALRLSRNFGQHAAITSGLEAARGRWVAVMDCDLQDPPEELPRLLETAREGFDVVLTERDQRRQPLHRRVTGYAYLMIRNRLTGVKINPRHSTLSVISRPVVDTFLRVGDRDRQYLMILHWLGFPTTTVMIAHRERGQGSSSYTFAKLLQVAVDGMFFQTTILLRWIVVLGFVLAMLGAAGTLALTIMYFVDRPLPGFTGLAALVLIIGGFTIVSTGVIGLYVGKIFEQVKGRPLFVVARRLPAGEDLHVPVPDAATAMSARPLGPHDVDDRGAA